MAHSRHFQPIKFTKEREIGMPVQCGTRDILYSNLYYHFHSYRRFDSCADQGKDWGGVFGFGFSPDGKILAAACENKYILLYDSANAKLIKTRGKTHDDCVNCVRFLDDRIFATCSDDTTVRLWDSRYLKEELRIFRGHQNWVKNIEYSSSLGKLITSGFDGNIYAWDINKYADESERLMFIRETMRTKMTRDESKLVISTFGGYFLLIHDLDINHLRSDLQELRRHFHKYLQIMTTSQQNYIMNGRKRNRVEFICDFPRIDEAKSISTIQVHPHGWCIVSRNTTSEEDSEWTCVHDIQSREWKKHHHHPKTSRDTRSPKETKSSSPSPEDSVSENYSTDRHDVSVETSQQLEATSIQPDHSLIMDQSSAESNEAETNITDNEAVDDSVGQSSSSSTASSSLSASSSGASNVPTPQASASDSAPCSLPPTAANEGDSVLLQRLLLTLRERVIRQERSRKAFLQLMEDNTYPYGQRNHFLQAEPRLLYYTEEPNVGRGFIKEQSFSHDGRIVASPYGNHVRLLAFDQNCSEICDNVPSSPRPLYEVANCALLNSSILSSTFSPVECMFVAGARDGSVVFSRPVL